VTDINSSTNAEISRDAAHTLASINVNGNVSVIAAGDDNPALDALISSSGSPQDCIDDACSGQANATPSIDFSGGPLNLSLGVGQSVIGVASPSQSR
jgi:hypothetical protein